MATSGGEHVESSPCTETHPFPRRSNDKQSRSRGDAFFEGTQNGKKLRKLLFGRVRSSIEKICGAGVKGVPEEKTVDGDRVLDLKEEKRKVYSLR